METIVLEKWKGSGKTVTDTSNLLKLNESGISLLRHPALRTWVSYVEMLKKNPYELLLLKLRSHDPDASLTRMIAATMSDYNNGIIARNMEDIQIESWLKAGKVTKNCLSSSS
ncbi:hypothetical protein JG687_00011766 [Phytophthora cactorum]|uniref:Uncharacterized protein n=1 Tax=Phytophthora cactorum TaxID=29920 RepID=A0A8T1U4Y5_9STRA|nr:hypothetical protein JG687_00011766 [Phytophthora cactorum]